MESCRRVAGAVVLLVVACIGSASSPPSHAGQVTLDGSFGTKGALAGPNYDIPASVGKTAGKNLFHSFGQFDLSKGDVATFSGPDTIQNVLSRVTGGKPSSIDGTIQSTIAGANFYFLNPKGVLFGPNARVDVSGSLVVTTANYIKLADGARFDTADPAKYDPLLTTAAPAAFGFLGPTVAPVVLQGVGGSDEVTPVAQVPDGETIAIIGGNIEIRNQWLIAPAGQVALVSVNSDGEFLFDARDAAFPVETEFFGELGQVLLDDFSLIDVSGEGAGRFVVHAESVAIQNNSFVFADTFGAGEGIGIEIQARGSVELINGGFLEAATFGDGSGGAIHIQADSVHFDGQADAGGNGGSAIATGSGGAGNSGDVLIEANSIVLENGSGITANGNGSGSSGAINLTASTILLDGHDYAATLGVDSFGDGQSGDIHLQAESVEVRNGAEILAQTHGSSDGGNILIETESLLLANRGVISASADGSGTGGNIVIQTSFLSLDGGGNASFLTGIASAALDTYGGGGQGGNITVMPGDTGALVMEIINGAQVSASSFRSGDGGSIDITATSISLDGEDTGILADNIIGSGKGGDILVRTDSLEIRNSARISATTSDEGGGGTIDVNAQSIVLHDGGLISATTTGDGAGGTIRLAANLIQVGAFSGITSETAFGLGAMSVGMFTS